MKLKEKLSERNEICKLTSKCRASRWASWSSLLIVSHEAADFRKTIQDLCNFSYKTAINLSYTERENRVEKVGRFRSFRQSWRSSMLVAFMGFGISLTLFVVVLVLGCLVRLFFRSFRVSLSLPLPVSARSFLFHGFSRLLPPQKHFLSALG